MQSNDKNVVQKLWKKVFWNAKKSGFKKHLPALFLVQFGINLHLWVFQKAEITLAEAARAISAFWKTHSCKLIPNWTRIRLITYTKYVSFNPLTTETSPKRCRF